MPGIVDCHGHIFPPLQGPCGFETADLHLAFQQRAMHMHGNQPVRSARDHRVVTEKHLWDADDPSEAGRNRNVAFRVARNGRYEWDKDGETYYLQFLPPSMQDMASPPEFMVTQMDYAGIERVVLQNDHIYGNLAAYFAEAIKTYPGRFIGTAQVEEAFAYKDDQMAALEDQLTRLGMKGLYFTVAGFFRNGFSEYYTDPSFEPFWSAVRAARVPVFWVFFARSPMGDFADEMRLFRGWLERYPDIPSVLVHGMPTALFPEEAGVVRFPDYITSVMDNFPVTSEVLYPISWGGRHEYPYPRALDHVRQVYERFGPDRLIWGSDMPNVERYCTYRQTLTYVHDHADFLSAEDRARIFRRNTLALFGLDG